MLFKEIEKIIICPFCKSKLKIIKSDLQSQSAILKCRCDFYPVMEGILYLQKRSAINKIIINFIKKRRFEKALQYLISFSLKSRIFFKLTYHLRFFYRYIGFTNFISILESLDYPKEWSTYIKDRHKIPSFLITLLALDLIKNRNEKILEVGCGAGQLIPFFYNYVFDSNYIGIDISFFNLYLARTFFARKKTILICANLDDGIPLKQNSIDKIFALDTLNYVRGKRNLFLEMKRVLSKNGQAAIMHIVGKNTTPRGLGINPMFIKNVVKEAGFKKYSYLTHASMWKKIKNTERVNIIGDKLSKDSHAYNVFIAKKTLTASLTLHKDYEEFIKQVSTGPYKNLI